MNYRKRKEVSEIVRWVELASDVNGEHEKNSS
jgi:hypothetical protein